MRITLTALALVLLLPVPARPELVLNGYFEPQYTGTQLDNDYWQLNSNKLRLDLSCDLSDRINFTGNVNFLNYNGRTAWDLRQFLPDKFAGQVDSEPDLEQWSVLEYEDEVKLDNAYLRLYCGLLTITAGRQQISVGSGYAFNPTDIFNQKDILDPTYEQPGVNGLRLDLGLTGDLTATLFYAPEDNFEQSGKLLRLAGRLSHFDWAVTVGRRTVNWSDYERLTTVADQSDLTGVDLNGELQGVGCWVEAAYHDPDCSADYWETLAGLDYTFESGWYLMLEYYRNEQGQTESDRYTLNDWLRYYTLESRTLARDQLYGYTSYPATDLITLGTSVAYAASDNSILLIPNLEYLLADELTLTVIGSIYLGPENTMYDREQGLGGMIRLRAYF